MKQTLRNYKNASWTIAGTLFLFLLAKAKASTDAKKFVWG